MDYRRANPQQVLLSSETILRKFRELVNIAFHKSGSEISYDQWLVLNVLAQKQGVRQIVVSRATNKEPASISRILALLEKKALIQKVPDASNKKANRIYLTPKGAEVQANTTKLFTKIANDGFNGVHEQEVNLFVRVIDKIVTNFNDMDHRK